MRRWRLSASIWVALSGLACGDARLVEGFADGATLMRVTPSTFIGDVPCSRGAEGALQSYVVRLQQLQPDGRPFDAGAGDDVQTSPPVPCDRAVQFPAVPGRLYAADISGFDGPVAEAAAGSVAPRWTATCGRGVAGVSDAGVVDPLAPTRALRGNTVPLRGCTTFGGPGSERGRLALDTASALGELRCGTGPGLVSFLEARLGQQRARAACGASLIVEAAAGSGYQSIDLLAFESPLDASAPPTEVEAGANEPTVPPLPIPSLDAGLDAALDAGLDPALLDAALPVPGSVGEDAGDAGLPTAAFVGVARWQGRCIGRALPGVVSPAGCEPLRPIAP